jgi:hypothetical protein
MSCAPSQDTALFLRLHRALWRMLRRARPPAMIPTVSVHLSKVGRLEERSGDLFAPLPPADRRRGEQVAVAVDHINRQQAVALLAVPRYRPEQALAGGIAPICAGLYTTPPKCL